jgi:hypothetical protein
MFAVNSASTFERVKQLLGLNDFACSIHSVGTYPEDPSFYRFETNQPECYVGQEFTQCEGSDPLTTRFCCCGGPCEISYIPPWIARGVDVETPMAYWQFDGYVAVLSDSMHGCMVHLYVVRAVGAWFLIRLCVRSSHTSRPHRNLAEMAVRMHACMFTGVH